jgi:hypothetical protein
MKDTFDLLKDDSVITDKFTKDINTTTQSLHDLIQKVNYHDAKLKNGTLPDEFLTLVSNIYRQYLVYVIEVIELFEYLLKKVVKLRFAAQDNRNSDKCAVFQQCCEFLIFLAWRVCYIAWHSSFWCRLLAFANRDLQFATERHAWQNFDDKGDDSPDKETSEEQEDTEDCSPDILFKTRKYGGIFSQSALAEGNTVDTECVNHYPLIRSGNAPPGPHHSKSIQDSIRVNLKSRRAQQAREPQ